MLVSAVRSLSPSEADELRHCEETIDRGSRVSSRVGAALAAVRDRRLFRDSYPTFKEYCRARWGLSRVEAQRLIEPF